MKISILIVDDEPLVCEGVANRVAMLALEDIECVECYYSGKDALARIRENPEQIYLLFADINMPGMSGLEFIRQARESVKKIRFIVLSAYKEFEYAQEALRMEAYDYLLKPVLFEQFERTLRDAIQKIQEEFGDADWIANAAALIELILSENDNRGKEDALAAYDSLSRWDCYQIAVFDAPAMRDLLIETDVTAIFLHSGMTCLFNHPENTEGRGLLSAFLRVGEGIRAAGLSRAGSIGELRCLYMEAKSLLPAAMLREENGLSIAQEASEGRKRQRIDINQPEWFSFEKSVHAFDRDKFRHFVEKHLPDQVAFQYSYTAINHLRMNIIRLLGRIAETLNIEISEPMQSTEGLRGMKNLREELLESFDSLHAALAEKLGRSPIEWSIRYIRENLENDIDMTVVANYFDMNYSYFSQLFKKKTGKNFQQFIKEIKMERARELLLSGKKLADIATMLGYANPKNFTRAFKDHYGVAPTHWRQVNMVVGKAP